MTPSIPMFPLTLVSVLAVSKHKRKKKLKAPALGYLLKIKRVVRLIFRAWDAKNKSIYIARISFVADLLVDKVDR